VNVAIGIFIGVLAVACGVLLALNTGLRKKVNRYEKIERDDYEAKAFREEKLAERTTTITVNSVEEVVAYAKKNRGKVRAYSGDGYGYLLEPEKLTNVNVRVVVDHQDNTVTGVITHVFDPYEFDRAKKNLIKDQLKKDLLG
jgi:hypothetical protein